MFVDVEPETYVVNIDQIEESITSKTKALMIPSLLGNVPDPVSYTHLPLPTILLV